MPDDDTPVWVDFSTTGLGGSELHATHHCACGWASEPHPIQVFAGLDELRGHLVDVHPAAVPFGRCDACGVITDFFRAHIPDLDTDTWLCDDHGPKIPTVIDQAGNDTEEIQWAEGD